MDFTGQSGQIGHLVDTHWTPKRRGVDTPVDTLWTQKKVIFQTENHFFVLGVIYFAVGVSFSVNVL